MRTHLEFTSVIPTSRRELFRFHMDFSNVRIVTPWFIPTRLKEFPETMQPGSRITVEINQFGLWMPWDIKVEQVIEDSLLVDVQQGRGPFAYWRHEHHFREQNGAVFLTDRIEYELPGGIFGRIADALVLRSIQRFVFSYRHRRTIQHFRTLTSA